MIKRLLFFLTMAAFISSCGNTKNEAKNNDATSTKVEFVSLVEKTGDYVGKTISVEGKVVHVCTHSGKKLFIVGNDPDIRLFIQAGEAMPRFPMDLLGSTVVVEGTLTKAGGADMHEGHSHGETEHAMNHEGSMAADTCETATAMAGQVALADVIMEYKSHVVKQVN